MFTRIDKAFTAGILQAIGTYTALATGNSSGDHLVQIGAAIGAGFVAGLIVFFVPNKP